MHVNDSIHRQNREVRGSELRRRLERGTLCIIRLLLRRIERRYGVIQKKLFH